MDPAPIYKQLRNRIVPLNLQKKNKKPRQSKQCPEEKVKIDTQRDYPHESDDVIFVSNSRDPVETIVLE